MADLRLETINECLTLKGQLSDDADFSIFEESLADGVVYSLSGLHSVSWLGLQNFVLFLEAKKTKVKLREVPAFLLRLFLLFDEIKEFVTIESFIPELESADSVSQDGAAVMEFQTALDQSLFLLKAPSGQSILGTGFQFQADFETRGKGFELSELEGLQNFNPEQLTFWYNYFIFNLICLESSWHTQKESFTMVEEIVHSLVNDLKTIRSVYELFFEKDERFDLKAMGTIFDEIMKFSDLNLEAIGKKTTEMKQLIFEFQNCLDGNTIDEDKLIEVQKKYIEYQLSLEKLVPFIDDAGEILCQKIIKMTFITDWQMQIEGLDNPELSPKAKKILKKKVLKNGEDVDDWAQVQSGIQKLFLGFEEEINRCILVLQQFDLVSQVFDHRFNEGTVANKTMESGPWTQSSLLEKVKEKLGSKLVTDLEKKAYDYFYEGRVQPEDSMNAGDVMLF